MLPNLQNGAAAAPSRFNEVGLYAPSQSQGLSPMNQQTVAPLRSKTAASNLHETSDSSSFSPKLTALYFLFLLFLSCVPLPFLFFSFLSSTLPTWEDNSPARKMIFLPLNHATALFLFRPLFFLFLEHNLTSCPHTCCTLFPFTCQNLAFLIFFP